MSITLTTTAGPDPGRVIELRSGDSVTVGRIEGNDYPFPADLEMSSRHFQIEGRPDCALLIDCHSTNGTFVNDQPIAETIVASGDVIRAGQTRFAVAVGAKKEPVPRPVAEPTQQQFSLTGSAIEICTGLTITDDAKPLLGAGQTAADYVKVLEQNALYSDALRVLSHAMGPQIALLWSCACVKKIQKDKLSDSELNALDAAEKWASEPSPQAAQAAHASAGELGNEGPSALLALAAYWGSGNVAPPGQPPLPTEKQLPSQAIAGALTLVAVDGPPKDAAGKYKEFISRAMSAASK